MRITIAEIWKFSYAYPPSWKHCGYYRNTLLDPLPAELSFYRWTAS